MDYVASAYDEALRMLTAGAMPIVIVGEDGLHVLSAIPNSREVVAAMINPDPQARLQFTVNVVCKVKQAVDSDRELRR